MVSGKLGAEVPPQKGSVLQIKQDDKFFCRLLSKETSMSHPSFRVAAVAVPFVWESQPGTPKYTIFSEDTLPPLTPPPSYYFNSITSCSSSSSNNKNNSKPLIKKLGSRSNLLLALFPKLLKLKKTNNILSPQSTKHSSPPSVSSSSSLPSSFSSNYCSSSWSSSLDSSSKVAPSIGSIGRRRFLSIGSSFDFRGDDVEEGATTSPTSTLCFGIRRSTSYKGNNGGSCRR